MPDDMSVCVVRPCDALDRPGRCGCALRGNRDRRDETTDDTGCAGLPCIVHGAVPSSCPSYIVSRFRRFESARPVRTQSAVTLSRVSVTVTVSDPAQRSIRGPVRDPDREARPREGGAEEALIITL